MATAAGMKIKRKSFLDTPPAKRKRWRPQLIDVAYFAGVLAGSLVTLISLYFTHHLK